MPAQPGEISLLSLPADPLEMILNPWTHEQLEHRESETVEINGDPGDAECPRIEQFGRHVPLAPQGSSEFTACRKPRRGIEFDIPVLINQKIARLDLSMNLALLMKVRQTLQRLPEHCPHQIRIHRALRNPRFEVPTHPLRDDPTSVFIDPMKPDDIVVTLGGQKSRLTPEQSGFLFACAIVELLDRHFAAERYFKRFKDVIAATLCDQRHGLVAGMVTECGLDSSA